jgi:hypothetical protein
MPARYRHIQDLTQPYHASLLPGVSTLRMLGINLLAVLGWPRMKDEMIVLLSNRHFALERYSAIAPARATTVRITLIPRVGLIRD